MFSTKHAVTLAALALMSIVLTSSGAVVRPEGGDRTRVDFAVKDPINDPGDEIASRRAKLEGSRYQGITVRVHPMAKDDMLTFQRQIVMMIDQFDFVPAARLGHFKQTYGGNETFKGWDGQIQEVEAVGEGILIRMKVSPQVVGGMAVINDYVEEFYLFDGSSLHFVGASTDDTPKVTTFN